MKKYIQPFLVLSVLAAEVICGKTTPCEDNWLAFQGSCYLIGHDNLHFIEAQRFCEHHGAYVVHINDAIENIFLKSFLGDLKDDIHWIGLTDEVTDGIWKWSDTDTVATYFNWLPGQPNNGKSGNCVAMRAEYHYEWTDDACSASFKALCEKRPAREPEIIG
ncbi:asialoglycoprotein receptor 2-like [Ruditapes philippinarum]|uniref:asialoglycoprotein receptor 2-like n=1 Tax=Ruditapes philippinarum TaxID=129788 RepID=UPI00295B333F|nr:asialoglycoprotein receptor 2-like [Ruditapes philippinarum]